MTRFLSGEDPLGQSFKETSGATFTIVGVTADVMKEDFDERRDAQVYVPYSQDAWRSMALVIRAESDPARLASAVRAEVSWRRRPRCCEARLKSWVYRL